MSYSEVLTGIVIGVTTTAVATGVTFHLKDYLRDRAKYKKFKEKLEEIAGKNAEVIIPYLGLVKILDINKQGIVVDNQLGKTFIPMEKVLQTEISLPINNYDNVRKELALKALKENLDLAFPPLMNKLKEVFVKEFLESGSELNAVVAFQVKSALKEEGIIESKTGEKAPTFREIIKHAEKKEKTKTA